MADALTRTLGAPTPQSEPRPGHKQVQNNAGGFVYEVGKWAQLRRFLIIGTEGGTYYVNERAHTLQNVACVDACLAEDPARLVAEATQVSTERLARKNDQAIFVLARAATSNDPVARSAAHAVIPAVCRTGTHLFQLMSYLRMLGGGKVKAGRGLRRALGRWYTSPTSYDLAYQAVKYRQREGWTHRDVLRLAHPKASSLDLTRRAVFDFMSGREYDPIAAPRVLNSHTAVNSPEADNTDATLFVVSHVVDGKLPWESIPDMHRTPAVWQALIPLMPIGALVRQLATLTRLGVVAPLSDNENYVVEKLRNAPAITKSGIHPIQVLDAALTYASGGARGQSRGERYEPSQAILAALDDTFRLAFGNVEPSGKRFYIGVDVSGSMSMAATNVMTCTEAAAALALVTAATEPRCYVRGFDNGVKDLGIHGGMTLQQATHAARAINGGGTDCALPMQDALRRGLLVDTFVVITDNETWAGSEHPSAALERYRTETGIPARLVVLAMTSTGFSIANPADVGMIDIVGFSADTPRVISQFSAGTF